MIIAIELIWYIYNFSFKNNKILFLITILIGFFAAILASLGVGLLVPTISSLINDNSTNYFFFVLNQVLFFFSLEYNIFNSLLIASLLIFLGDLFAYISSIISSYLTKIALVDSRTTLFKVVLFEDFNNIIENKTGEIISIVNEQASLASELIESFFRLILNTLFAIFLVIALCFISIDLTILSIFIGAFVLISQHKIYSLFRVYWRSWQENKIDLTTYYNDLINSIKFIKQTGREEIKTLDLKKMSNKEGNAIFKALIYKYLSPFYTKGIATWLVFCIVLVGLEFFNSTGPQILIFLIIVRKLQSSVNQINLAFIDISKSYINVNIIKKYLDKQKNIKIKYGSKDFALTDKIEFRNLSLKYNDKLVLDGLSLKIPATSFFSIVGGSGSGKTTIFNIFSRIVQQNDGCILIDDINIEEIEKNNFFKNICFVSQDSYVFNGSIKDNIADGENFDELRFKEAIKITQSDQFINSLKEQENTKIGERGLKISGGQLQRLILSRAIYKNPKILFIDEATSALDPLIEEQILFNIKQNFPKMTVINIAHRLSSIKNSDSICLLQEGKIVFMGSYKLITKESDVFRSLFKLND